MKDLFFSIPIFQSYCLVLFSPSPSSSSPPSPPHPPIMKASVIAFAALITAAVAAPPPPHHPPHHPPPRDTPGCRCLPGDLCWPAAPAWSNLNTKLGGRLIKTVPIGSPCHDPTYDAAACQALQDNWTHPQPQYVMITLPLPLPPPLSELLDSNGSPVVSERGIRHPS